MDQSYAADVCMEPILWFVDNFTQAIGPVSTLPLANKRNKTAEFL